MDLYLNPNGRIDQPTYWRAVLVLFGISAAVSVAGAFVNPFFGLLGIVFAWPWIAVHAKRFHDSDKTGWLTVAMVVAAMVLFLILGFVLGLIFSVDSARIQAEMQEEINRAAAREDMEALMSAMMDGLKQTNQAQLLPSIAATGIVTGILGAIMGLMKTDPKDNQYGPGPGSSASVFG